MDHRLEVRGFLTSRRDRLTPDRAGLPAYGGNRRVPGLRREEVALLSGVSVDYYTRLERGDLSGASDSVLDALARALQLDDAETAHLFDLARTANASPAARKPRKSADGIRPSIQRLLDAITDAPAMIRNNYFDYVAANRFGRALHAPADPGLSLSTYTAEPGSPSADALRMLASWAATSAPAADQASPAEGRTV